MDKIKIVGGKVLSGEVKISGAKNAALPILFSALLAEGEHVFTNVPELKDIESTLALLESLGVRSHWRAPNELVLKVSRPEKLEAHYDLVRKMRASFLCLGPLLTKYHEAVVSLPGGCAIGTRPVDMHLEAFKSLGAHLEIKNGYVHASSKGLIGAEHMFPIPTVGGTENAIMAAVLAKGRTVLNGCAKEPEIVDLVLYLRKMGAQILGEGSDKIIIDGVNVLSPSQHAIMGDRIEAGTYLIAAGITKGHVTVKGISPQHLTSFISAMEEAGFDFKLDVDAITLFSPPTYRCVDIQTNPHPYFPTDLQAQFMALMSLGEGSCQITESVFENRFMHIQELARLGSQITPVGPVANVKGVSKLTGAAVMATDLRASACLVLAGLAAEGETIVHRIYHLDRGYERLEEKLRAIGANVERVDLT